MAKIPYVTATSRKRELLTIVGNSTITTTNAVQMTVCAGVNSCLASRARRLVAERPRDSQKSAITAWAYTFLDRQSALRQTVCLATFMRLGGA